MTKKKPLEEIKTLSLEIHHLQSALSLLHWDQETHMPPGGLIPRSHQIAHLSSIIHEKKTSKKFERALSKLVGIKTAKPKIKGLNFQEKTMLREWVKDFSRLCKLPSSFVKNYSQVTSEATQVWAIARKDSNFALFAPFLKKIVELNREKAEILGFSDHPYDPLLEHYEPSMNTKHVTDIFSRLQKKLTALLQSLKSGKKTHCRFLFRKVDPLVQKMLAQTLLAKLPIEKEYTRLDYSTHPFSIALHPQDSRITSRILPNNFMSNLSSTLHEAGHSLYEMGLPLEYWGTPLAESASLSVHESQSRWWETLIGRNPPFLKMFYPELKKALPSIFRGISLETFYKAYNQVSPSYIRVEADEVSYCLHVILRFEIEKELIEGSLDPYDVPRAWKEKMKKYLGVVPPNDRLGCLQDIHWSLGDFGYFPTYALGNLLAAQTFAAFEKEHVGYEKKIAKGDLQFVRDWLKENVHQWGRTYSLTQFAKNISQKPFSENAYCSYLKKKYEKIYRG